MNTISLRMNDEDTKLLRDYVSVNKLSMSHFIRELLWTLEWIELDEAVNFMLMKRLKVKKHDHRSLGDVKFNHVQGRIFRISSKSIKKLDRHTARVIKN